MFATASLITVSVFRPRKSNFNIPVFSRLTMSYCVITRSPFPDSAAAPRAGAVITGT